MTHVYDDSDREPIESTESTEGVDFGPNDPLPDIPAAGDDSVPITSPNPIDFSTDGIAYAGSVGMSTFNDGTDESLFERTVDAYEDADADSPILGGNEDEEPTGDAQVF